MNILLVTSPFVSLREPYAGGTESFVVDFANELVNKGHTVDVIAQDTDERNLFTIIGFKESPLSMKDNAYRPSTELQGQRYYQSLQFGRFDVSTYDVIHYHSYVPELYEMGALFDTPSILTLHVPPLERFSIMYRLFIKQSAAVPVAISQRMQSQWEDVLKNPIRTIVDGIDLHKWTAHERDTDGYFLWIGRIAKEKNVEAAVNLAKHLRRPLKIVGPVFDQGYFDETLKPSLGDGIEYVPNASQAKVNELLAGASALLATASWNEPFGLSTLESLASGVPVLGFASAVAPELRHDGLTFAVDSHDWHDLIEPAGQLESVRSADCRKFAATFSIGSTADSYVKLYKELVRP